MKLQSIFHSERILIFALVSELFVHPKMIDSLDSVDFHKTASKSVEYFVNRKFPQTIDYLIRFFKEQFSFREKIEKGTANL